jgi:hypothetical protein
MPRGGSAPYFRRQGAFVENRLTWLAVRGCVTSALRPYGPLGFPQDKSGPTIGAPSVPVRVSAAAADIDSFPTRVQKARLAFL